MTRQHHKILLILLYQSLTHSLTHTHTHTHTSSAFIFQRSSPTLATGRLWSQADWLCILTVTPWASYLTSVSHIFLMSKMRIISVPASQGPRKVKSESHSCPTLCDSMDCSLSLSSVHGILQVAISFSRGSSQTGDQTQVSCIAGGFFTS